MITKIYDFGWGPELLTKQLEARILDQYLRPWTQDRVPTVIINNCWYTDQAHESVVAELRSQPPQRIVLVSMIDAAICHPARFQDLAPEIRCVGYYDSPDTIDFWALAVDEWFQVPDSPLWAPDAVDLPFMCLNRKPHWHRQKLYDQLVATGLVDRGIVSMGAVTENQDPQRSLPLDVSTFDPALSPNAGIQQTGIVNDIMSLGHPDNWRRIMLNIVTETQFDLRRTHFVSEKIYKPIMGLKPFLVYAQDGAVSWLVQHGFEPYVEDFRDITDLDLARPRNMIPFLEILCSQPDTYWRHKIIDLQHKIMYNRQQFDRYVSQINFKIQQGIQCQI